MLNKMSEKRLAHTIGVEQEGVKLAEIFGCGAEIAEKIRTAARLHDLTKELDRESQPEICARYNISLSEDDMRAEKGLHAKTGAYIARHEYGADDVIFDAIYNHTYGAPYDKFDIVGKIIYLADYIEPGRDFQDCLDVRGYFYESLGSARSFEERIKVLDEAILYSLNKTLAALIADGVYIHESTVRSRNSFIVRGELVSKV